jgi:alpha-glucosidase
LKVIIDLVLNHSSEAHPWFQESRQNRTNPKADWYVWADPKPDGNPPNNWLSIFGGSAWQWEPRRQQYYLHNFLASQPDLNFHNPEVTRQLLKDVEFWLERGVDGFRLDVVNFYFHDRDLRDNPPADATATRPDGVKANNPYAFQIHVYDKTRPENLEFLKRLRALLDRYPGTTSVGEIGADNALGTMAEYTSQGDKLHMAYTFNLLSDEFSTGHIRNVVETLQASIGDGWPCWSLSNHDVTRVMTRWGGQNPPEQLASVLMAMLLSLRGSVCIYQGDELGLTEADIPLEKLQDPFGINFWPEFKGRDGCRTPMPWESTQPWAGFSEVEPWLPVPDEHRALAIDLQQANPLSVLDSYRVFLKWRRDHAALRLGDISFLDSTGSVLALTRAHAGERILVVLNLSADSVVFKLPSQWAVTPLEGHGFSGRLSDDLVQLTGYDAFFGQITS